MPPNNTRLLPERARRPLGAAMPVPPPPPPPPNLRSSRSLSVPSRPGMMRASIFRHSPLLLLAAALIALAVFFAPGGRPAQAHQADAPTGLIASASNETTIGMIWNASSGAIGYDVGYTRNASVGLQDAGNDPPEAGWVWYAQTARTATSGGRTLIGHFGTSINITGLRAGTSYRVRVRAVHSYDPAHTPAYGASDWVQTTVTTPGNAPTFNTVWWGCHPNALETIDQPGGQNCPQADTAPRLGRIIAGSSDHAELVAQMREWRNDPQWASNEDHTDRWDRALLAFGETVSDTSLTAMTAAEAQGYADRGWERWVDVAAALREIEAAGQPQSQPQQRAEPEPQVETAQPPPPPNRAPELASAIGDVSGLEAGATREVALAGAFSDPDGDPLTVTAASGDESVATVEVAADDSALTVTGVAAGTATITVTAGDADGNSVSDTFEVSVVKAPEPEPEPEATEPSAVVARYDVNDNGAIDIAEYIQALRDRAAGRLGADEWEEILSAWLASAYD